MEQRKLTDQANTVADLAKVCAAFLLFSNKMFLFATVLLIYNRKFYPLTDAESNLTQGIVIFI